LAEQMSRRSIVTVRDTPVEKVVSAAGGLVIRGETFDVETSDRIELVDMTDAVMAYVRKAGVREGMISLWAMHTTCTLFINESQKALDADIKKFLEDTVARDKYYMHNDPNHSDCDRQNADSHLRAMMLGHSLTMQISGGELVLGRWQRVMMGELDGPRARSVRAQVWGIS
jgi:secondary thiamine-phosphate synthase enzyme